MNNSHKLSHSILSLEFWDKICQEKINLEYYDKMSQTDFEVSNKRMKLPYLRFLSDSASGLFLIVSVILFYKLQLNYWFAWRFEDIQIGSELKIFVLFIIFLLASPIGLIINAISWFLLGKSQTYLGELFLRIPIKYSYLIFTSKILFYYDDMVEFFSCNDGKNCLDEGKSETFYKFAQLIEELFFEFYPSIYSKINHIKGLSRLVRNLALLSFVAFGLSFTLVIYAPVIAVICISCAIFFLLLNGLLEAFVTLKIMFSLYTLCRSFKIGPGTQYEIMETVVEIALMREEKIEHSLIYNRPDCFHSFINRRRIR